MHFGTFCFLLTLSETPKNEGIQMMRLNLRRIKETDDIFIYEDENGKL